MHELLIGVLAICMILTGTMLLLRGFQSNWYVANTVVLTIYEIVNPWWPIILFLLVLWCFTIIGLWKRYA